MTTPERKPSDEVVGMMSVLVLMLLVFAGIWGAMYFMTWGADGTSTALWWTLFVSSCLGGVFYIHLSVAITAAFPRVIVGITLMLLVLCTAAAWFTWPDIAELFL